MEWRRPCQLSLPIAWHSPALLVGCREVSNHGKHWFHPGPRCLQGALNLLEAVRGSGLADKCKIYQASTSEMFGKVHEVPQRETTPFHPRSPYGVAKVYAYWIFVNYRWARDASTGLARGLLHRGCLPGPA